MTILILNWKDIKHPQVGGAEIIVYELARRLVNDGNQVTWFCRNFIGGKSEEIIDGIKIVRRGNLLTTYLHAPIYYWGLKTKPDLIIDISNTIYWQSPVWAWKSKKIAYLNQLAKDVFYYEYPPAISRVGIFFEKFQYISYKKSQFICYAKSTKQDLESFGVPSKNIQIFTLGMDHSRYVPGKKSSTPLFICVNRLVNMKRTDLAIRAMAIIAKRYPTAKLVIVGTGYARVSLEKLRNEINLQNTVSFADENVWFFDHNPKDKKLELMQQAWALIFPSVKEGWGMTVTECAVCGTPAIVSDVTGLRDSVRKNETGLIVSHHPSPEELALAIEKIISDTKLRNNLSRNAILWAKEFSWEKSYKQFSQIIFSL